jgi:kynureninase
MSPDRGDCLAMDATDGLARLRERFEMPEGLVYLDGNSLGCLPKAVAPRVAQAVMQEWGQGLIRSWNDAGWYRAPQRTGARIARLVGAGVDEVIVTDSTSINLFKVLSGALRLRPGRQKILGIDGDFPTDAYMADGLATLAGKRFVRTEVTSLLEAIDEDVAVLSLTHVNYRTGQIHDMAAITRAAHAKGALVVWDLSHSAGVMPLALGEVRADFAVGCGYKYLNGGPGAPAYLFVSRRHQAAFNQPLTGWLGHADPFAFSRDYVPAEGLDRALTGTPPMLSLIALEAALEVFDGVDMLAVRRKSQELTSLFIDLAEVRLAGHGFGLASPKLAAVRGSQVSLTHPDGYAIMQALIDRGVIGDFRAPDIMRFGLSPLTTRFVDVFDAVATVADIMRSRSWDKPGYRSLKAVT